jgi:hypothetical protein
MANRIYIRAWKKEDGTSVADREIVYVRKEKALYIGVGNNTVVKLCDANLDTQSFATKEYVDGLVASLNARIDELNAKIDALPSE